MFLSIHSKKFALAALIVFVLGGCRFGNYSEAPKVDPNANTGTYRLVELYRTTPTELRTYAVYNDQSQTTTDTASVAWVPNSSRAIFSDPFYFAVPTDSSQPIELIGADGRSFTYTRSTGADRFAIDENDSIGDYSNPAPLWRNNTACLTQIQRFNEGALDRSHAGSMISGGKTVPIAGRAAVDFTVMQVVAGTCAADLTAMAQCYQGTLDCTADELRAVTNFFDLYVRQSHALNLNDAARISVLAYSVHFE